MKKTLIFIIISTAIYSFLFYDQHAGVNFLLFSVVMIAFTLMNNIQLFKQKVWLVSAGLVLYSGCCVLIYGSLLSVWTNILCLLMLSAYSYNQQASVLLNLFTSVYSVLSSPVYLVINSINANNSGKKRNYLNILVIAVPLFFGLIFFFIYKNANPLFAEYTKNLNIDFISINWILFTTGGFYLVYGFFFHQRIADLDSFENKLTSKLNEGITNLSKWNEKTAAIILFILLNSMLLFINLLDVNYLYLGAGMPEGINHKQFVHHGVNMLIISILLGISLILFFFRGKLNFGINNRLIRFLTYGWIIQNAFMVVSTFIRHNMYVFDALLSYKRIGVYFWLLLTLIGLIATYIKLYKRKTIWYLVKTNTAIAFFIFVISASIDWDKFITDFNLNRMQRENIAPLDKHYLLCLSETNIASLYTIKDKMGFEIDSSYSYHYNYMGSNISWLDHKLYQFLNRHSEDHWPSYSIRESRVYDEISTLFSKGKINSLDLSMEHKPSLKPLYLYKNLNELILVGCYPENLAELSNFPNLKHLNLDKNYLKNLDSLKENNSLQFLSGNNNELNNLAFLNKFPSLTEAEFSSNNITSLQSMPVLNQLRSLSLDDNPLVDIKRLSDMPGLNKLSLSYIDNVFGALPPMKNLKEFVMKGSGYSIAAAFANNNLFPSLNILELSDNNLYNINFLFIPDFNQTPYTPKAPLLVELSLNNNNLSQLDHLELCTQLETLCVHENKISESDVLKNLSKLKKLDIGNNSLKNIEFLNNLILLSELDLSENKNINDFSPLKNLNYLIKLNLSNTIFDDLSLIQSSKTLTTLYLEKCNLKTLDGIEKLISLETLSLSYLKKEDIVLLKKLPKLKQLKISLTDQSVIKCIMKEMPGLNLSTSDLL